MFKKVFFIITLVLSLGVIFGCGKSKVNTKGNALNPQSDANAIIYLQRSQSSKPPLDISYVFEILPGRIIKTTYGDVLYHNEQIHYGKTLVGNEFKNNYKTYETNLSKKNWDAVNALIDELYNHESEYMDVGDDAVVLTAYIKNRTYYTNYFSPNNCSDETLIKLAQTILDVCKIH